MEHPSDEYVEVEADSVERCVVLLLNKVFQLMSGEGEELSPITVSVPFSHYFAVELINAVLEVCEVKGVKPVRVLDVKVGDRVSVTFSTTSLISNPIKAATYHNYLFSTSPCKLRVLLDL
jgi:hypothetical protein